MEKVLREMVMQVSEKVKETEEKINHSYLTLRKIILSQVIFVFILVHSIKKTTRTLQFTYKLGKG